MKINVLRGGHNFACPGASALIDETTEDRKVCAAAISYLKLSGDTAVDATPGNCDEHTDLNYGTNTANNAKADIFVPIHFNKAYDSYTGAIGCEVWVNPKSSSAVATGTRIVNNLAALGFKNRGLKDGMNAEHLHDIRTSNMPAVLVEVCFVEATVDVVLYKKLGADRVGRAIAEGIVGHATNGVSVVTTPLVAPTTTIIAVPTTRVNNSISELQVELNNQGAKLLVDGFFGPSTLKACPTLKIGANGNVTKWLQKRLALKLQDGLFGSGTNTAVKNYQTALKMSSDGIVGQGTWAALLK